MNCTHILRLSPDLGGRLKKLTGFANYPIDLGGEWIHVPPAILDTIADVDAGEERPTQDIDTVLYLDTYQEYDDGEWVTQNFDSSKTDYKFVDYTWYDYFNDWIAPDLRANIVTKCQVKEIDNEVASHHSTVHCADGRTFTADRVIVTAPMSILSTDIKFKPALPSQVTAAINAYDMLPGLKVFMKFNKKFFHEAFEFASDFVGITGEENERYFYSPGFGQKEDPEGNYVLGIFAVGKNATKFIDKPSQEIYQDILKQLDAAYDGQATKHYKGEGHIQNWSKEPFARGAYTHLSGNYDSVLETLRAPRFDKRLYFAGEAIPAEGYMNGFAHEAALSGRSAAQKIIKVSDFSEERRTLNNESSSAGVAADMTGINAAWGFGSLVWFLARKMW